MILLWPDRRRQLRESAVERVNVILLAGYTVLPDRVEHLFNFIRSVLIQANEGFSRSL